MFCPYCRQELPGDAAFCNRCGQKMPGSQADYISPTTIRLDQNPILHNIAVQDSYNDFFAPTRVQTAPIATNQAPQVQLPPTALQRLLVQLFQPSLAGNALFGVMAGSLVAVVGGIFLSWLLLTIAHAIAQSDLPTAYSTNGTDSMDFILGILALHAPFRESIELLLVIQGAGLHILYGAAGTNADNYTFIAPLNGLLIVPALLLTVGGYIAASTDLHNQTPNSLLRGSTIAIPYTIILLILASQVDGIIPGPAGATNPQQSVLSIDTVTLIIFGLLWGTLFGLLGASLKVARGQWRHMLRELLRQSPHPQIAGMIAGGCSASGLGLGLSLLTLSGLLAYTTLSIPLLLRNLCITGNWQLLTAWGAAQGPLHAANLFFFAFGTPITLHHTQAISCFYSALPPTALTLRDGSLHLPAWVYLLCLLPALSLFIGGRVSVATYRTQAIGSNAIQGALVAVPFAILMVFMAFISTSTNTYVLAAGSGGSPTPQIASVGASIFDVLLWSLLSGALFGALGGIYEGSAAKVYVKQFLSDLAPILELLGKPLDLLLDRLGKQSSSLRRNPTHQLLCGALFFALILAIVAFGVGWILIANNQTISLQDNQRLRDIVSTLLITLPGLFLFCSCAAALSRDPIEEK